MPMPKTFAFRRTGSILESFKDVNPNGNPNDQNRPRVDDYLEGTYGLMSDVCHKHLWRETMSTLHPELLMYIARGETLFAKNKALCKGLETSGKNRMSPELQAAAQSELLTRFIDNRLFGVTAVGGTEKDAVDGKKKRFGLESVPGPIRVDWSHSLWPVVSKEDANSRCCLTNVTDTDKVGDEIPENRDAAVSESGTFCDYKRIQYGVYETLVRACPFMAAKSGATDEDMDRLLEAIVRWPQVIHSRARTAEMLRVFVFTHDCALGNVQDGVLHRMVCGMVKKLKDEPRSVADISYPDAKQVQEALKANGIKGVTVIAAVAQAYGR